MSTIGYFSHFPLCPIRKSKKFSGNLSNSQVPFFGFPNSAFWQIWDSGLIAKDQDFRTWDHYRSP